MTGEPTKRDKVIVAVGAALLVLPGLVMITASLWFMWPRPTVEIGQILLATGAVVAVIVMPRWWLDRKRRKDTGQS